jgi:4-hydroxyphenylpyruvate dioxygenase
MPQLAERPISAAIDFLPLMGTDFVEFYVGNARQTAHYYRSTFGMQLTGYSGPETGVRDRASYVLEQGKIRFVLTTALRPDQAISEHVRLHGDGVKDIALTVDDADSAYRETTQRGARGVREPFTLSDAAGEVRMASIATYGDTIHTFVGIIAEHFCLVLLPWTVPTKFHGRRDSNTSITWWATSAGTR